jgi:hypothetical protein
MNIKLTELPRFYLYLSSIIDVVVGIYALRDLSHPIGWIVYHNYRIPLNMIDIFFGGLGVIAIYGLFFNKRYGLYSVILSEVIYLIYNNLIFIKTQRMYGEYIYSLFIFLMCILEYMNPIKI